MVSFQQRMTRVRAAGATHRACSVAQCVLCSADGARTQQDIWQDCSMGVVEWQPCVAFDLVVPLGMQAPGTVGACASRQSCIIVHALGRVVALAWSRAVPKCLESRTVGPQVPVLRCHDWHENNWNYRPPLARGRQSGGLRLIRVAWARVGRSTRGQGAASSLSRCRGPGPWVGDVLGLFRIRARHRPGTRSRPVQGT